MTALTTGRDTKRVEETRITLPVAENVTIYEGAIVVVNGSGYAAPATTGLAQKAVGRADERITNGAVAGAVTVKVSKGAFWYANSGADPITIAAINRQCYLVDDQTVALTDGAETRSVAGRIVNVDATLGVCVEIGKPGLVA